MERDEDRRRGVDWLDVAYALALLVAVGCLLGFTLVAAMYLGADLL